MLWHTVEQKPAAPFLLRLLTWAVQNTRLNAPLVLSSVEPPTSAPQIKILIGKLVVICCWTCLITVALLQQSSNNSFIRWAKLLKVHHKWYFVIIHIIAQKPKMRWSLILSLANYRPLRFVIIVTNASTCKRFSGQHSSNNVFLLSYRFRPRIVTVQRRSK